MVRSVTPAGRVSSRGARWGRRLAQGLLLTGVGMAAAWLIVHRVQGAGPAVADGLRAVAGVEAVAHLEDTVYALEDRFNQLWYRDPELYQPRPAGAPRRVGAGSAAGPYYRSERQTLLRLPDTRAVIFAIHTYVLARGDVPPLR